MADDPDPPRQFYALKPKAFEAVNDSLPAAPAGAIPSAPDPGPSAVSHERIDVRDLARQAATPGAVLRPGGGRKDVNQVHDLLRANYAREKAAGGFDLGPLDDSKRRRRVRNYWLAIFLINVPLGLIAWKVGPGSALFFVFTIAAMALLTSYLTWQTFFLRTHYD
jgi:hypothetical protein